MKRSVVIICTAVVLIIAGMAVYWMNGSAEPSAGTAPGPRSAAGKQAEPAGKPVEPPPPEPIRLDEVERNVPEDALPAPEIVPRATVAFRGDQVIATVNGRAVFGWDLAPFDERSARAERSMSPEMYEARVARAIERELTFQEAEVRGIEVPESEMSRLEERADIGAGGEYLLGNRASVREHTLQDARARVLERSILEAEGVPPPHVTEEQVQAYYDEHPDEFAPLSDDENIRDGQWQEIEFEIRQQLTPVARQTYQDERDALFESLRQNAAVNVYLSVGDE